MEEQNMALQAVSSTGGTSMAMMNDGALMDRMIRFAEIMATGKSTIPNELRNVGDCLAITMQAYAWGMMPQAVAQKCFFLNGRIGYEAQLVAAAINNSGSVKGNFHFEWYGPWDRVVGKFEIKKGEKGEYRVPGWKLADEEGIGVRVWATLRGEDKPRELELLLAQARVRNSTQWADDPKQQLAYLAQKKWARLYAPGVILGVYTQDELEPVEKDMGAAEVVGRNEPAPLPAYPDEEFQKNLPAWRAAIEAGRVTAEQVFGRSSTKYVWSDDQKAELFAIRETPAQNTEPAPTVIDAEFTKQYEQGEQK